MLFNALFSALPLILSLSLFPFASASPSTNFTLNRPEARTTVDKSGWLKQKCANVQGNYYGYKYNFGCLCNDDVDEFCSNNKINAYIKSLLYNYISDNGATYTFPPNAQPLCNGDYSCGSLTKLSDGTCGKTTCGQNQCSTNGGCCPRGQTYQNGQCCGRVGCSRSGQTCTPVLQCSTYESNDVCCPSGTSNWIGYDTVCCPKGQYESKGACVCPAGTKKNGNSCDSVCPTGHKWCSSKCCPNGSSQVGDNCVCDSNQQQLNQDKTACVDKCTSGFTFYTSQCCPSGATENKSGKCECSAQQTLTGTGSSAKCIDKCPTGFTYYTSKCCPSGATEIGGQCVCSSNQQKLTGSGNSAQCVNKCATGLTFYTTTCCPSGATEGKDGKCYCTSSSQTLTGTGDSAKCTDKCDSSSKWCKSKCCKSYMDEDSNGKCVCPTAGYVDNGQKCVSKCGSDEKYNTGTGNCDKICDASAGYYYQQGWRGTGMCCKKGHTACNTVCCQPGTEEIGSTGVCCVKGSTVQNGKCVSPTGGNTPARRALAGRLQSVQLNLPATPKTYGLEANKNGKLCPAGLAACPIPGRKEEYECLDALSDLQSCGGCISLGSGVDCTAIEGAKWMGCNVGVCEVYSCRKGFKKAADGASCIKL